jgi:rhamnose transport system permease protein
VTPEQVAAAAVPLGRADANAPLKADTGSPLRWLFRERDLYLVLIVRALFVGLQLLRVFRARELSLALIVLALFVGLQLRTGDFLTARNMASLLTDAALLTVCALATTAVLLAEGLDISLGALMALSAAVAGRMWADGSPLPVVLAVAMLVGAAGGALNALLSTLGRVHPIVITLGTLSLYRGLTHWRLQKNLLLSNDVRAGFLSEWLGLPVLAWVGIAVLVLFVVLLRWSAWGRSLYAVGSNPVVARRAGLERWRVWLTAFTVQGMLLGLAGVLYLANSGELQSTGHEDKTLAAIAASVVGGVAITGGRGSAFGVALGALFLVSLGPACTLLHIPARWQQALVGAVMVVAVTADTLWRGRAHRA